MGLPPGAVEPHLSNLAPQQDLGGGESDALIATNEAMVVGERGHHSSALRPLLLQTRAPLRSYGVVIAGLWMRNGLNHALIADPTETPKHLEHSWS